MPFFLLEPQETHMTHRKNVYLCKLLLNNKNKMVTIRKPVV